MRDNGAHTAQGEAMRYLAELPWVSHAMLANRQLEWREPALLWSPSRLG